jgi:hypothetical protein
LKSFKLFQSLLLRKACSVKLIVWFLLPAEVFHGITSCVAHLIGRNVMGLNKIQSRHRPAAQQQQSFTINTAADKKFEHNSKSFLWRMAC